MITAQCPQCAAVCEFADILAGRQAKCRHCGARLVVPASANPGAGNPGASAPAAHLASAAGAGANAPDPAAGWGRILLAAGVVLVLVSRGCDSVGRRAVTRSEARLAQAQADFENTWDEKAYKDDLDGRSYTRRIAELEKQESEAATKAGTRAEREEVSNRFSEKKRRLRKSKENFDKDKADDAEALAKGEWRDLRITGEAAAFSSGTSGYWCEWGFVIGSVGVMLGCLLVGFRGVGAERIVCLVMIAIITFSLYIGGAAWVSSTAENIKASAKPDRSRRVRLRASDFDAPKPAPWKR